MARVLVDAATIALVVALYGFLFWIARSMRSHLTRPEEPRHARRIEVRTETGETGAWASLGGPVVIGRSREAGLVIEDPYASDFHARIAPEGDGRFRIQDMGSTNGTFVNGDRLGAPATVGPGDEIQIGRTTMGIR
jgi:pSer/pThr/pTyr-binding forkhead associated (FHA) protein